MNERLRLLLTPIDQLTAEERTKLPPLVTKAQINEALRKVEVSPRKVRRGGVQCY